MVLLRIEGLAEIAAPGSIVASGWGSMDLVRAASPLRPGQALVRR